MPAPKLPRRRVLSHGERRTVLTEQARYVFAVDVLACGHEVYAGHGQASRGCTPCHNGLGPGFHPHEVRQNCCPGTPTNEGGTL